MSTSAMVTAPVLVMSHMSHALTPTNVSKQLKTTEDVRAAPWPEPCVSPVVWTVASPVCCLVSYPDDTEHVTAAMPRTLLLPRLIFAVGLNIMVPYQPTSIIGNRNEGNNGLGLREHINLKSSIVFTSKNNAHLLKCTKMFPHSFF